MKLGKPQGFDLVGKTSAFRAITQWEIYGNTTGDMTFLIWNMSENINLIRVKRINQPL